MKKKSPNPDSKRRAKVRFWPSLILGLVILIVAAVLWRQLTATTFQEDVLRKLPKDSYVVGLSRLDSLDQDSLKRLAGSTNVYAAQTTQVFDVLKAAGVSRDRLKETFKNQFAFASTTHGGLAIFTVADQAKLQSLNSSLGGQLEGRQDIQEDGDRYLSGTLKGTGLTVTMASIGKQVYVASNKELIKAAKNELDGFTTVEGFADVSQKLPAATDGYLFYNTNLVRGQVGLDVGFLGVAWDDAGDHYDLTVQTASPSKVVESLPGTTSKYLPPTSLATGSVEGTDIVRYLHLLEEQRQESDLPAVLSLQNGLASLNRTLGTDVERDYLGAAKGQFVYGRFPTVDGGNDWMGLLEFPDSQTAENKVAGFTNLARAKLTIPVRKEVVTVLPDNTQSREIVSEGRIPLAFGPFSVEGRSGLATTLPGNFGTIYFLTDERFLVMGGSPEAVGRMLKARRSPAPVDQAGQLAVRVKLTGAKGLLADPDPLSAWVFATRPATGKFYLNKTTGDLSGAVQFNSQQ